jgi:hypothetical protein
MCFLMQLAPLVKFLILTIARFLSLSIQIALNGDLKST